MSPVGFAGHYAKPVVPAPRWPNHVVVPAPIFLELASPMCPAEDRCVRSSCATLFTSTGKLIPSLVEAQGYAFESERKKCHLSNLRSLPVPLDATCVMVPFVPQLRFVSVDVH